MKRLPHTPIYLLLALASAAPAYAESGPSEGPPPNILFIFADDWGWGDLGCHGHPQIKTPVLDQLATEGTNFHQFTANSGVCSPSRTALLTGHFPARYNINRHFATVTHNKRSKMPDWLNPKAPMLPRVLQAHGYKTYHFGKWHLTNTHIPDAPNPKEYGYDSTAVFNGPGQQTGKDELYDRAIEVINKSGDDPFFINLWIHETHTAHYPKPEFLERYKHLGEQMQVYAAVVTHADYQIGRVLEALEKKGIADNTVVIFTSDNGPENTGSPQKKKLHHEGHEPGLGTYYSVGSSGGLKGRKRSLHEGGVRVPLIIRWPGKVAAGEVDDDNVVSGVDWFPTLAAIAGAELPEGYTSDGEDRSSALLGKGTAREKPMFWLWPKPGGGTNWPYAAIRLGPWKLLKDPSAQRIELYHIPSDRAESNNLAAAEPAIVDELLGRLDQWISGLPDKPDSSCFSKLRKEAD